METQKVKKQSSAGNDYVKSFFKNLFNFKRTATRPEFFWGFFMWILLFNILCNAVFIAGIVIGEISFGEEQSSSWLPIVWAVVGIVIVLCFVVLTALVVRRLRDAGTSIKWGIAFVWLMPLACYGACVLWLTATDKEICWNDFFNTEELMEYWYLSLLFIVSVVSLVVFIPVSIKTLMGLCKKSRT